MRCGLLSNYCEVCCCCTGAVPSPAVSCVGELIRATFSRGVDPLLGAAHLSVAGDYGGPALVNCSYTTSSSSDGEYVSIAVPFVGGGCNTSRQVDQVSQCGAQHTIRYDTIRYEMLV